jgi:ferritin
MISDKMYEGLNDQVRKEMESAYLYMAMSAQCADMNWSGFEAWFMAQYHEEMFHAMKIYRYLLDQGRKPRIQAFSAPPTEYPSLKAMFEKTYAHEQGVTASINALMKLAKSESDYATEGFLAWYVKEQVEEEKNDTEILAQLTKVGESQNGLFQLDHRYGHRKTGVPTDFLSLAGED